MMISPDAAITASVFDNAPLFRSVSVISGVNLLGLAISLATGSHLHLDLIGTNAFTFAALPSLLQKGVVSRVRASSLAVVVWGVKLSSFLFFRALRVKTDVRLDETLSSTGGTVGFWVISALWGILCSLPHTLGTTSSSPGSNQCTIAGTAVYAVGLIIETLADCQKWTFKQENPGQFCNAGLWSISQHPNFFGNLLLWAGIFIINAPALVGPLPPPQNVNVGILGYVMSCKRLVIAMLSPLFMWTLFYGQASGSITDSVNMATAKYGNDPAYMEYIKNVPLIIPNFFSKK